MSQTNLTMKYPKITTLSIILYGIALTAGCIVAYFDDQYTKDLGKYDFLCIGVLATGLLGIVAPFTKPAGSFPIKTERVFTRILGIVIGMLHFLFLKNLCTSSHPDNSYLAMRFFYFFMGWYMLTIFAPRSAPEKSIAV